MSRARIGSNLAILLLVLGILGNIVGVISGYGRNRNGMPWHDLSGPL